jgi:hypothetical protein
MTRVRSGTPVDAPFGTGRPDSSVATGTVLSFFRSSLAVRAAEPSMTGAHFTVNVALSRDGDDEIKSGESKKMDGNLNSSPL